MPEDVPGRRKFHISIFYILRIVLFQVHIPPEFIFENKHPKAKQAGRIMNAFRQ